MRVLKIKIMEKPPNFIDKNVFTDEFKYNQFLPIFQEKYTAS
jgi:hypothetical protein